MFSKTSWEVYKHLESITEAVRGIPEKIKIFYNHTMFNLIPLEVMASLVKSTNTRTGRGRISFENLVKNKNKVKAEPSSAALPLKDKKRKSIETVDLSSPKKAVVDSIDKPKALVLTHNASTSSSPPEDFETLSILLVEYLRASKVPIDEATKRSSVAEKRASDLSIQLSDIKEKSSKAFLEAEDHVFRLEDQLSKMEIELSGARDELSKVNVELSQSRDMYDEVKKDHDALSEKSARMAMELAMFFGQKSRLELMEVYVEGRHTN